jgi:hypothetical protein
MPVCTLRQTLASIEARLKDEWLRQERIEEWHVKTLAQAIVSTSMADPKSKKQMLAEVAKLKIGMSEALGEEQSEAKKEVPLEVFIEQGSQVADNGAGSYEQLRQMFGGGATTR